MTDARENIVRKLVEKIATEQNYDNPDIKTAAIPATGANFCSQLITATIKSEGKKDLNLFAKVSVMGSTMRGQAGDMFLIEKFFYTELLKKYQALENKHNVPEEHRLFVPKCYGHSENYLQEVIVWEDLSKQGFKNFDRLKSLDWDNASKLIEELVKLHALSLAFQREQPADYKHALKVTEETKFFIEKGTFEAFFEVSKPQIIQAAKEENRQQLLKFYDVYTNEKNFTKIIKSTKRPVFVHHDYRPSNFMYKVDENGKLQIAVLDFQTVEEASAAVDLMHLIFLGCDGPFRAKYYHQLIEHYYVNLTAALRRLHLDPEEVFPRADFDEELNQILPYGFVVAFAVIPLITIDLQDVTVTEDGAFESESVDAFTNLLSKGNPICTKRLKEVINEYVRCDMI